MKNLLKIGFVAGFTLFSTLVFAGNNDNLISLKTGASSTINIELANAKSVSLYVYNSTDSEIYSEDIKSSGKIIKAYNFKNMPSGNYYLVAESDFKVEKYKIIVFNGNVSVEKAPIEEMYKPEYNVDGNHVSLRINDLKDKVKISVYDLSDYVYYDVVQAPEDGKLNIKFDLNPEVANAYVIRIEKDGEVFKQTFFVK